MARDTRLPATLAGSFQTRSQFVDQSVHMALVGLEGRIAWFDIGLDDVHSVGLSRSWRFVAEERLADRVLFDLVLKLAHAPNSAIRYHIISRSNDTCRTGSRHRQGPAMNLGLKNKVVMVGGASQGLGYAVAQALAREGACVSIASRQRDGVGRAAAAITKETG